jgi:hypothetical protein
VKIIFLILLGMSLLQADFTKNGDVVVDNSSNLMWEDTEGALMDEVYWLDAITRCEDLTLAGYDDWRLPNINELLSIRNNLGDFEYGREAYTEDATYPHWSSTRGITVGYDYMGQVQKPIGLDSAIGHARCVRGGE